MKWSFPSHRQLHKLSSSHQKRAWLCPRLRAHSDNFPSHDRQTAATPCQEEYSTNTICYKPGGSLHPLTQHFSSETRFLVPTCVVPNIAERLCHVTTHSGSSPQGGSPLSSNSVVFCAGVAEAPEHVGSHGTTIQLNLAAKCFSVSAD